MTTVLLPDEISVDPEFQKLISPLTDEEQATLEASILNHGQQDPIRLWGDIVVDGHHRLKICRKNNMPIKANPINFANRSEAMVWMIDNQKGRRNLTKQQMLELGFKRAELLKPKAEENRGAKPGPGRGHTEKVRPKIDKPFKPIDTLTEAAGYAGVSRAQAGKYKHVMEKAPEEIKEKVRSGEMKIGTAYKKIKNIKDAPSKRKPAPVDVKPGNAKTALEAIQPKCEVSDAQSFAYMAITNLRQIRDDDPGRQEALDGVIEWINEHREKGD